MTDRTPHDFDAGREPERDPALAAALRAAEDDAPLDAVDWDRLRAGIAARAELPLARLRRESAAAPAPAPAARPAARRLSRRTWIPLAAAACVAAVAALGLWPDGRPAAGGELPPEQEALVDAILAESLPDGFVGLVSGEAAEEALLEAAVGA